MLVKDEIKKTRNRIKKYCSIENCNLKHYAKNFCRKHYSHYKKYGSPFRLYKLFKTGKNCLINNCLNKSFSSGYCQKHYAKYKKYGNPLFSKEGWNKGVGNPLWKGGISEYSDQKLMQRNRLIKFKQVNYICEKCNLNKVEIIHHIDGSKNNHELDNLMSLCKRCHFDIHKENRKILKKILT